MYAEKATRLFLQVAQEVNTLDSRVLFSDARVQADGFLEKLLHGYGRLSIPAKRFTAAIQEQHIDSQRKWISLESMMQDNMVTMAMASVCY